MRLILALALSGCAMEPGSLSELCPEPSRSLDDGGSEDRNGLNYEARLANEGRDDVWANAKEATVRTAWAALEADGVELTEVNCQTTMCGLSFAVDLETTGLQGWKGPVIQLMEEDGCGFGEAKNPAEAEACGVWRVRSYLFCDRGPRRP